MQQHNTAFEQAKDQFLAGLAHFEASAFEPAERCFRASLTHLPGRVSTLVNLAATLLALGKQEDVLGVTADILAQEADNQDALLHRATALHFLGRMDDALAHFDQLLALNDGVGEYCLRHAQTLQALERHDEAFKSYQRAVALDPTLTTAWVNLGSLLRESGRHQEAAHAFHQAIANGADTELVRYYLASVSDDGLALTAPSMAPPHYVQALFDAYAHDFDNHLVNVLGYKIHVLLHQHLQTLAPGRRFQSALDLGCGTGLCGGLVHPHTQRMVGVDLSQQMLDQAAQLGIYDELVRADIVEHLRDKTRAPMTPHDLVVATDVFIYVGDLKPAFEAIHAAMQNGGLFCFSAEAVNDETQDYALLPSLRYAHSERYLRHLASVHGFEVMLLRREPLREDQRKPIMGFLVYLRRL